MFNNFFLLQNILSRPFDLLQLVQRKVQWQAFIETVVNLRVSWSLGIWLTKQLSVSIGQICSVGMFVTLIRWIYQYLLNVTLNYTSKSFEVLGGRRRLQNDELHNLCISLNIIRMIKLRRMRWTGRVALMGEVINSYTIFVGKPEEKRTLWRSRCRWADNIRMDLTESVGSCGLDSSDSEQGPVAGSCEQGNETSGTIKGRKFD